MLNKFVKFLGMEVIEPLQVQIFIVLSLETIYCYMWYECSLILEYSELCLLKTKPST